MREWNGLKKSNNKWKGDCIMRKNELWKDELIGRGLNWRRWMNQWKKVDYLIEWI